MRVFEFVIALFDVDLSAYTAGFSRVSPTFVVSGPQSGTVALQGGSDGSAYTSEVLALAAP